MGLFGKKDGGAIADVIRCDEPTYLIWKWHPAGTDGNSKRENSIRFGSRLRVKDGEVAVFVYPQKNTGVMQDFIEGPYDETLKTANFPVLSGIMGAAFGGSSPFQAEVYFINLAGVIQVKFGVPYFDVFDPRYLDFAVPISVRGTISFKIADYREFIKLHRLINFDLQAFQLQIRDAVIKYVKGVVTNVPSEHQIPVMQIERKVLQINDIVEAYLKPRLQNDFGVIVSALDISSIEADKESDGYIELKAVTADLATQTAQAQTAVNIQNMQDTQRINAENMSESLRIQREQAAYAQKLQTEGANFQVHQLNQQTRVAMAGADALGQMGASGAMGGSGNGGFNPATMMAGMAMGGAVGQNMAGMMNNMMQGMNQPGQGLVPPQMAPPQMPVSKYFVGVNGQPTGPFDIQTLAQMVSSNQLNQSSMVWKEGMQQWQAAGTVSELSSLFGAPSMPPLM